MNKYFKRKWRRYHVYDDGNTLAVSRVPRRQLPGGSFQVIEYEACEELKQERDEAVKLMREAISEYEKLIDKLKDTR